VVPPSTLIAWPVMKAPISEHRKAQIAPNSSGCPNRLVGLAVLISSVTAPTSREEFFASAARFDFGIESAGQQIVDRHIVLGN